MGRLGLFVRARGPVRKLAKPSQATIALRPTEQEPLAADALYKYFYAASFAVAFFRPAFLATAGF